MTNLTITQTAPLAMSEVLGVLSNALDTTAGHAAGHAHRACAIGMRIGVALDLPSDRLRELYYALLLKDAGASSSATRLWEICGANEVEAKRAYRLVDWTNSVEAARFLATYGRKDDSLFNRAKRVLRAVGDPVAVGGGIVRDRAIGSEQALKQLQMSDRIVEGVRYQGERWDGSGGPSGLTSLAIPLISRIIAVSSALDSYASEGGPAAALDIVASRTNHWYDPEIIAPMLSVRNDKRYWDQLYSDPKRILEIYETSWEIEEATPLKVEAVCKAFGKIVDAKSPYTRGHSQRVSEYAVEIGRALNLGERNLHTLRRAALLHDIGKLAVPNSILEKPSKLTTEEWTKIKKYPHRTENLLGAIPGFRRLARVASAHNERLDGRGYHLGVAGEHLDMDMRIIAVADVYDALTSDRPQRQALPLDQVFGILDKDAGVGLDSDCVSVLKQKYRSGGFATRVDRKAA